MDKLASNLTVFWQFRESAVSTTNLRRAFIGNNSSCWVYYWSKLTRITLFIVSEAVIQVPKRDIVFWGWTMLWFPVGGVTEQVKWNNSFIHSCHCKWLLQMFSFLTVAMADRCDLSAKFGLLVPFEFHRCIAGSGSNLWNKRTMRKGALLTENLSLGQQKTYLWVSDQLKL